MVCFAVLTLLGKVSSTLTHTRRQLEGAGFSCIVGVTTVGRCLSDRCNTNTCCLHMTKPMRQLTRLLEQLVDRVFQIDKVCCALVGTSLIRAAKSVLERLADMVKVLQKGTFHWEPRDNAC